MYLDFLVKIPDVPGKIVKLTKKGTTYIDYEYERTYDAEKKYTRPRRSTIGKLSDNDETMMIPNQNFLKFFPDIELPEEKNRNISEFLIACTITDLKASPLIMPSLSIHTESPLSSSLSTIGHTCSLSFLE